VKKTLVIVLVVIVLVLALGIAGALGFVWYRDNHVFVEGTAYPIGAQSLDLREEDISFEHYDSLRDQLPGCDILWNVPFQGGKHSSDTEKLTISALTEADIEVLEVYFADLKTVDATACHDYAILETLMERLPNLEVSYGVSLGGQTYAPQITDIVLSNGEYDFVTLMENLVYLRQLTAVKLRMPELTTEQLEELQETYANITFTCTAEILGQEYETDTTELDLSALTSDGVPGVLEKLPLLPGLAYVNLMDAEGTSELTKEDVKTLMAGAPGVVFDYAFDFYGERLSTADEEILLKNKKIGDEGETELRLALDLLTNCKRMVLEYCGISYDILAQIRDDYRDQTKVVWRVEFGGGHTLTDVEIIRCTYDLVDDNCENLKYCEDVRFVDFGHNEWLDGCDFVAGMKSLEYCILSGAPIKSLDAFANCKNLKFLEIAFCEYIEDVTPLASCKNLQMLNISNTHALDLTPLDDLPLTYFCARTNPSGKSRIAQDEQERFLQQHPDCWTSFDGAQPYGVGWRYGEDEITPLPQYELIQKVFKLPNAPNNVGWYLDDETKEMIAAMEPAAEEAQAAEETVETIAETTNEE